MWTALLSLAAAVVQAAPIGVSVENGKTSIFGNSFGVPGVNATYDYVIVGGGTAGNTIAARLALSGASVAVLESGSFYEILNGNRTQIPGYNWAAVPSVFADGLFTSLVGYDLVSTPQPGYNDREIRYIAGQGFGGGSAANYGGYFRATEGSLERWASDVGDDFWLWDNVFPFYQRSCNFTPPDYTKIDPRINFTYDPDAFDNELGGPLHVSYGNHMGWFNEDLGNAFAALGFEEHPGANSGRQMGYAVTTSVVDPEYGTRDSSETSFLQMAAHATDIKLYPNTIAQNIIFDDERRARGVQVTVNNAFHQFQYEIHARNEVIVAAGVWHSPQLLMLSGIGPAATLEEHGIDVIQDLPGVGQNSWDQPWLSGTYRVNYSTMTQIQAENPQALLAAREQFENSQSGPQTSIGAGVIGFEKHTAAHRASLSQSTLDFIDSFPSDWPDAEYLPLEAAAFPEDVGPDDYYLALGCALFTTSSRGNMTLNTTNVLDSPIISPNFLQDEGDAEQALAAVHRIREIAEASEGVIEEYLPGPDYQTDEDLLEWLRDNMALIYHAVGTCKMGSQDDVMAVVDSRARVYGVQGLRVVDASAFPIAPPGQPMATVYMLAEAIAESILTGDA